MAKSLPLEGRPLGMYITRSIRRTFGDARIAATVGDPIAWMLAYAEAAKQNAVIAPRCREGQSRSCTSNDRPAASRARA